MGEVGHILGIGLWVLKNATEHVREPSGLPCPMCGEGGGPAGRRRVEGPRVCERVRRAASPFHHCVFVRLRKKPHPMSNNPINGTRTKEAAVFDHRSWHIPGWHKITDLFCVFHELGKRPTYQLVWKRTKTVSYTSHTHTHVRHWPSGQIRVMLQMSVA